MSLYEDEDLGGPPTVSSWSRGKCKVSVRTRIALNYLQHCLRLITNIYFLMLLRPFRGPIDAVANATQKSRESRCF